MRLRTLILPLAVTMTLAAPASALTGRDLSARMRIDGYTNEFVPGDEDVFGIDSTRGVLQEARDDSKWQNNEITNIRVT